MPTWLGEGLTVLVFGMGTVLVTLLLLAQVIGVFGRVAARREGARPGGGLGEGPGAGLREDQPQPPPDGSREARREALRAAAVAAAITAYLDAEAGAGGASGWAGSPPAGGADARPRGPAAWVAAGRMDLMSTRQELQRRGRFPR
ncbi:MAG: hypothetical protein AB1645_01740 [Bacillota bacterium]